MNKCYTEPGKRGLSCIRYNKKKYWTGHFLCSNFLLKHVIEEKVDGRIEVTERRSRLWTCCSKQQTMDCSVRVCGLAAPNRTLWTVLSASVDLLLQTGHYGLFCQHLWTFCSNKDIMDCTVSVFGLAVPTRTLWTVLSASVDLLFQPGLYGLFQLGHYGLFCQCLWTCCSNQDIMDCSVSLCGLAVPTRTLWTVLSASVDLLFQPRHYGLFCQRLWTCCSNQDVMDSPTWSKQQQFVLNFTTNQQRNKQTNKVFCPRDSSLRTGVILIHNRHRRLDRELRRNCLTRHKGLLDASRSLSMWWRPVICTQLFVNLFSCSVTFLFSVLVSYTCIPEASGLQIQVHSLTVCFPWCHRLINLETCVVWRLKPRNPIITEPQTS